MTTTKYTVGDKVVCHGHLGTVIELHAHNGISVRLERGEVEVDADDVLPGEVWPQLVKMGESDARKARKEGSILIAQTSRGTVDLRYVVAEKRFEGTIADELNPRAGHCVVNARTIKECGLQLATLYRVEVA